MINTWIVAGVVGAVAGVVGFFVVVRGSAFAAHALPLGAFPGAAGAALLGINTMYGLVVFAGLGVVGITRLGRRGRHDVATALTLVVMLGLGALFLSMTGEYAPAIYSLLFGEVLGISANEVAPVLVLAAVSIAAVLVLYRPLMLSSISAELAEARGIPRDGIELAFLAVVGLVAAMALPVVGALLVFSLMVGPPAAARAFTDKPQVAMVLSVVLALATVWVSIALSYRSNWPVGFFVGSIGAIDFGIGRVWAAWRRNRSVRTEARTTVAG
ncbi:MAG: metal ABC transporter permease [Acidimicrobiales bacterium]